MHPRTVKMAAEVASSLLSSGDVDLYGNIIKNGYLSVVPNTTNKKAWQYAETTTAPVDLPSLTETRPAYRGWTTNYMQYYTRPNRDWPAVSYSPVTKSFIEPGSPGAVNNTIDNVFGILAPIVSVSLTGASNDYPPGVYTNIDLQTNPFLFGDNGTIDVEINDEGRIVNWSINNPGQAYRFNERVFVRPFDVGGGTSNIEFKVKALDLSNPYAGYMRYTRSPVRLSNLVAFRPAAAIGYSFIAPQESRVYQQFPNIVVADRGLPPIDWVDANYGN